MKKLHIELVGAVDNEQARIIERYGIHIDELNGNITLGEGCKVRKMKVKRAWVNE
jgi:hypothetical protein